MKVKQKEVNNRIKDELNLMMLKRAQDEISKEKQYKEHFINFNNVQMKRSQALLHNLQGKPKNDSFEEDLNYRILRGHNRSVQIPKSSSMHEIKNGIEYIDSGNNDYQSKQQYNMERDNENLDQFRRSQYKHALDEQLKLKKVDGSNLMGKSRGFGKAEGGRNDNGKMAMIPGINSTSPLIRKDRKVGVEQTLDEHRRKMKQFIRGNNPIKFDMVGSAPYEYQQVTRNRIVNGEPQHQLQSSGSARINSSLGSIKLH
jgi:hypothetical protein